MTHQHWKNTFRALLVWSVPHNLWPNALCSFSWFKSLGFQINLADALHMFCAFSCLHLCSLIFFSYRMFCFLLFISTRSHPWGAEQSSLENSFLTRLPGAWTRHLVEPWSRGLWVWICLLQPHRWLWISWLSTFFTWIVGKARLLSESYCKGG